MNTPIALFVYNRPDHTRRTIEALQQNELAEESDLYIFADGEKPGVSSEVMSSIKAVRDIISQVKGFRNVFVKVADKNLGLEQSILNGINQVLENNNGIIVLEDDIVTSKYFLTFCNQGLDKYKDEENVAAISGYMFPVNSKSAEAFFLPTIACWGWATWKRSWKQYNGNANALLDTIYRNNEESLFDLNRSYPYMNMLKMKASGKINSWAICWYASIFNRKGLMLYPPVSLVNNVGMDGSGTNFVTKSRQDPFKITSLSEQKFDLPLQVQQSKIMQKKVEKFLRTIHFPNITERIISKVRQSIQKLSLV